MEEKTSLEETTENAESNPPKLLISWEKQLGQIQLPELSGPGDFHIVSVLITSTELKAHLNGYPVNLETGDPSLPPQRDNLLQAAEILAQAWADGGWKISKDYAVVQAAYENWLRAKTGHTIPAKPEPPPLRDLLPTQTAPKRPGAFPKNRVIREGQATQHPDAPITPIQLPDVSEEDLKAMEDCACPGPCEVHPGAGEN